MRYSLIQRWWIRRFPDQLGIEDYGPLHRWIETHWVFPRTRGEDARCGMRTVGRLYSRFWNEIDGWSPGHQLVYDLDSDEPTDEQREKARDLRMRMFAYICEELGADRGAGRIERLMVRGFLLGLPFQLFPPLPERIRRFYGIKQKDWDVRRAVTKDVLRTVTEVVQEQDV